MKNKFYTWDISRELTEFSSVRGNIKLGYISKFILNSNADYLNKNAGYLVGHAYKDDSSYVEDNLSEIFEDWFL